MTRRDKAIQLMEWSQSEAASDFMNVAQVAMPVVLVPGALPAMKRYTIQPEMLPLPVDVCLQFAIGDFVRHDCSSYFDPASPWYNVFYGSYGLRSRKPDGASWGFTAAGDLDLSEFFQVPRFDYNDLTAGMFECPVPQRRFTVAAFRRLRWQPNGWHVAEVEATIPSGLHDPHTRLSYPLAHKMYGIPDPSFLTNGHAPYEPVDVVGQFFIKPVSPAGAPQPITLAWGAACPVANGGPELLRRILDVMGTTYLPL